MIFTITEKHGISIHLKMDNMAFQTYFLKMGGAKNLQLVTISNDNWEYLLRSRINITAEYIPSAMNIEGNRDKPGIQASGN